MTTAIKFGTSGWRAIVADEFTVANIGLAVAGIAAYVKTLPRRTGVIAPGFAATPEAKTASGGPRVLVGAIRAFWARALWPRRRACWLARALRRS